MREKNSYDHRTIQAHHDLIAECFRWVHKVPGRFVWVIHGKAGWFDFFNRGMKKQLKDPEMLQLFMTAVAYTNTKMGYDAEDELLINLITMWGDDDWSNCRGHNWVAV